MAKTEPDINNILFHLEDQLDKCWRSFYVAKNIDQAYRSGKIRSTHYFFTTAYEACIESSFLAFSRMVLPNKDSIYFEYMLNCIEQNPESLHGATKAEILESVKQHRQQLSALTPLIQKIKQERNERIAHLARRFVGDPNAVFQHPFILANDFERAFKLLLQIVNTYNGYLMPSKEFGLDQIEPNVKEDIDFVVRLLNRKKGAGNV